MKKKAARNHPESAGVERVDHDGETQVVEPQDIEVSQKERLEWYENGAPDKDEKLLHKHENVETSFDDGGNPMWRNEEHRTSNPRPHQYSTERRLQEEREPGSTFDVISNASVEQATARAFAMVSPLVQSGTNVADKDIVKISSATGVPIQNVISLEGIARKNPDLANKYAGIPGLVVGDEPGLEKESEPNECKCQDGKGAEKECNCSEQCACKDKPLAEEELNQIGMESGLC